MTKLRGKTLALAVGAALAAGVAAQASAEAVFTINPSALPGGSFAPFQASFISGISSELATFPGGGATTTGQGYIRFSSFSLNGTPLDGFQTGLGSSPAADYGLFATFQVAGFLSSGPGGAPPGPNSSYTLTQADFQVKADPGVNNLFSPSTTTGAGTAATVVDVGGDDVFLAAGSLIAGTANSNSLGGVALNVNDFFDVCTGPGVASRGGVPVAQPGCLSGTGSLFFAAPIPFFSLVFAEFNNISGGASPTQAGGNISINSASGGVGFAAVPEPGSLALMGLALAGVGVASRRQKKTG
jgi:hypothetical protein